MQTQLTVMLYENYYKKYLFRVPALIIYKNRTIIVKILFNIFKFFFNYSEYQTDIDAVQNMNWSDDMDEPVTENVQTKIQRKCPGHEVCFSIESTVQLLDIPEENISTLLCYLELHEQRYIQVLSKAYCMCKVMSYGGPTSIR